MDPSAVVEEVAPHLAEVLVEGNVPPDKVVMRFQDAWNQHDVDAVMALMTEDCVFESTWPPPDGQRVEGQVDVRAFWELFFDENPGAVIDVEELFSCGDRVTMRWRYRWSSAPVPHEHVRGVDVYRLREGRITEKLSYVKG